MNEYHPCYKYAFHMYMWIYANFKNKFTLSGGSLGSWVDEERSKLREFMWTAGHMNIDILNAYCGLYWQVSQLKLYRPHMVEGCIIMPIEFVFPFHMENNNEVLLCLSVYNILWIHFDHPFIWMNQMHFDRYNPTIARKLVWWIKYSNNICKSMILFFDICNMLMTPIKLFNVHWNAQCIKFYNITSAHVRLLPEFKHINEGRKRN